ncbi:uncharacterized protein [Nicotiana tomentosiformis]|uniref:uncharacterized protein n=1 Tax=Nicotiana tomentosiformis TaxID=4098 RepID=UPI00051B2C1C|nr:uncharacterized protein LOC104096470 isoform X2 [Nicotiana tomentosiformis]XP_016441659.1 PREDICTED: uncharacterized protein LOC107767223 [Nicotiana tabacum]
MAEKYSIGLLGVMDRLWFHQIILFSEPSSVSFPENQCQSTLVPQKEFSSVESESTLLQDVCEKEEANEKESTQPKERPTRLNTTSTRNRSHSTSPYKKHSRNLCSERRVLEKHMSCKSLGELELEEVKGFVDLGFIFRKEHISKRMISVIPGLQRLEVVVSEDEETNNEDSEEEEGQPGTPSSRYAWGPGNGRTTRIYCAQPYATEEEEEEEEDKREIVRPYLSEAWLIKKPDSPLLNLRVPRISAAADMKKHLRCWAKTVATVVLQES